MTSTDSQMILATLFPGEDEASTLARTTAWECTPLGPADGWSEELRAAGGAEAEAGRAEMSRAGAADMGAFQW